MFFILIAAVLFQPTLTKSRLPHPYGDYLFPDKAYPGSMVEESADKPTPLVLADSSDPLRNTNPGKVVPTDQRARQLPSRLFVPPVPGNSRPSPPERRNPPSSRTPVPRPRPRKFFRPLPGGPGPALPPPVQGPGPVIPPRVQGPGPVIRPPVQGPGPALPPPAQGPGPVILPHLPTGGPGPALPPPVQGPGPVILPHLPTGGPGPALPPPVQGPGPALLPPAQGPGPVILPHLPTGAWILVIGSTVNQGKNYILWTVNAC
ncbi:hypothetical protein Q1695_001328 [Nippostrongylus brasiliensis]|nr:hypothetical protein Q1695_001328 [Nippostrongylus brasiliensis]